MPLPPLNPQQREFARGHLEVQRVISNGRKLGENPELTISRLSGLSFGQVTYLQGAGGTGKTALLKQMKQVMADLKLGTMVITSWTGVACA